MPSLNQPRWRRAIRFALGDTAAQRCVQFALLVPAGLWLRLRNMHAPWEGVLGKHIREGKTLDFDEKIKVQLWEAADLCCALLFVLVILSPWWLRWVCRRREQDKKPEESEALERHLVEMGGEPAAPSHATVMKAVHRGNRGFTRRTLLWLLLIMGIAFAVRWPLYERTIMRDEQDSVRRNIIGYMVEDTPGKQEPVMLDWKTTIWEDAQANNPFLFSILARTTLRAWQALTHAQPWQVNLQVLRLWALIPGLLSLVAIWWSLRLMGHPRAAWIALAVGAIHPMHADYSTQARGYALVLLFASLSPGVAWLAMVEGRWRYWIGLAACFLGMLYANPASAYFVASLGGALALCLGWRAFVCKDARSRCDFARLGICGAMAFLVFVPLIWPALPQAAGYLKKEMQGSIGGVWPLSAWSRYSSGVMMPDAELGRQWLKFDPDEPSELMLRRRAVDFIQEHYVPEEPLLFVMVFLIVPALLVAGAHRYFRQHPAMWPVLAGSIAAPFLGYALHHWVLYTFIYYWYLIYAMPVVLMLFGLGLEAAGEVCRNRFKRGWAFLGPALGFVLLLLWVNRAGPGRLGWTQPPFTHPEIFDRGRFLWITHPEGQTVRVPDPDGK